jgi:Golgi phosphoprotein 3 (GPP34)
MSYETLARRVFLVLHDPFTGKPGVSLDGVKYGLVTAVLADLVTQRRIGVHNGRVTVLDRRGTGSGDVATFLLQGIERQSESYIARSWVESFTDATYEMVARGLVADGIVRRENGGRRVVRRNPDRFPAADLVRAAGPKVRLEHMLRSPHDLDFDGATLAAIIEALHLDRVIDLDRERPAVRVALITAARQVTADIRELVDSVAAAVSAISLDFRRL